MRTPLLLALLSTSAVACSTVEDPVSSDVNHDSSDQNLLVRVNRGSEQSVSFLAVGQGAVLITQTGGKGAVPLQLSNDPLTAFQEAAPGHAVPAVLATAARAPKAGEVALAVEALVPAQPVILDLEAPVIASSFPASAFGCWPRNRYSCFTNRITHEDIPGNWWPEPRTLNIAWAVDRDFLPIEMVLARGGGGEQILNYQVNDGYWMTWSLTDNFAVIVENNINTHTHPWSTIRSNARFHYSSAGAQ